MDRKSIAMEEMNENATETKNIVYQWNRPLHAAVEAGLGDTTHVDICGPTTEVWIDHAVFQRRNPKCPASHLRSR